MIKIDISDVIIHDDYILVKEPTIDEFERKILIEKKINAEIIVIDLYKKIKSIESKIELIEDIEIKQIVLDELEKLFFKKSLYEIDINEVDKKLN